MRKATSIASWWTYSFHYPSSWSRDTHRIDTQTHTHTHIDLLVKPSSNPPSWPVVQVKYCANQKENSSWPERYRQASRQTRSKQTNDLQCQIATIKYTTTVHRQLLQHAHTLTANIKYAPWHCEWSSHHYYGWRKSDISTNFKLHSRQWD